MANFAAENVPRNIPDDIFGEILIYLPVKCLVRFRRVSKSWCALISNPKFIKTHLAKSSNRDDYAHHLVFFRSNSSDLDSIHEFDTRYFPLGPALFGPQSSTIESTPVYDDVMTCEDGKIVGCCNGLFCVIVRDELFFWNPAIRKFKKLAEFYPRKKWSHRQFLFEYDESDKDYKVCVVAFGPSGCWIDVYSGNTDTWRRIKDFALGRWSDQQFCFVKGKLHWNEVGKINSFDLEIEEYGVVEHPDYRKHPSDFDLQVLGGCLALCCYYGHEVDLWIMKEYGIKQSWTKVLLVPKFKDPEVGNSCKYCNPIFMSTNGKIVFRYWKFLALYDPKLNSVRYPHVTLMGHPWQMEAYVESLVLLDDHNAIGPKVEADRQQKNSNEGARGRTGRRRRRKRRRERQEEGVVVWG